MIRALIQQIKNAEASCIDKLIQSFQTDDSSIRNNHCFAMKKELEIYRHKYEQLATMINEGIHFCSAEQLSALRPWIRSQTCMIRGNVKKTSPQDGYRMELVIFQIALPQRYQNSFFS